MSEPDPELETLPAETRGRIVHEVDAVEAECPYDDFHDVYTVDVEYLPRERVLEIRSLRRYLDGFRGVEISHEAFTEAVFGTIEAALSPAWLAVTVETNEYVGVVTTIRRTSGDDVADDRVGGLEG